MGLKNRCLPRRLLWFGFALIFALRLRTALIMFLSRKNYAARVRGLPLCFVVFTHSLRCGLEGYRQLRWLIFTFVPSSSPTGLYLCSNQ